MGAIPIDIATRARQAKRAIRTNGKSFPLVRNPWCQPVEGADGARVSTGVGLKV
jgi:uncharacterized Fe-S cluster protein YjdI